MRRKLVKRTWNNRDRFLNSEITRYPTSIALAQSARREIALTHPRTIALITEKQVAETLVWQNFQTNCA
ncbi:MAG: hypothetical protein MJA27_25510 [Pseudanabaenales cyanobacterium]|nr:hypothetical protein [Pseudanabaenales cyanobacterium]